MRHIAIRSPRRRLLLHFLQAPPCSGHPAHLRTVARVTNHSPVDGILIKDQRGKLLHLWEAVRGYSSCSPVDERRRLLDTTKMAHRPSLTSVVRKLQRETKAVLGDTSRTSMEGEHRSYEAPDDESLTQTQQAVFMLSLIATSVIALFVLAPRLAFSGSPQQNRFLNTLFVLQQVFSVVYLILYLFGVNASKYIRHKKSMALSTAVVNYEDEDEPLDPGVPWTFDRPVNVVLQVCCASIIPVLTDFTLLATGNIALRWVGTLRLLYIINFNTTFSMLDMNLSLPASLTPLLRNILILLLITHYAACLYWLLARWKGFAENTWVGTHRPELVDASANTQYIHSLYFSVITMSVPAWNLSVRSSMTSFRIAGRLLATATSILFRRRRSS